MPDQLQLALAFLILAAVSTSEGSYGKGDAGYKNMQHLVVDTINKQILVPGSPHAVNFYSSRAVEWDQVLSTSIRDGRTYERSRIENFCTKDVLECKKAIRDIWAVAVKGQSPGGSAADAGIYTKCSDLKATIGLEGQVANCA